MKGLWHLLSRIKDYKRSFILSIISNILMSIFTVISIPLLVPFFSMLFDTAQATAVKPSGSNPIDWIRYYIAELIQTQGKEVALTGVCISVIIVFLLKNVFRYTSQYFMAPLRNGIIYDLRKELYQKYLDLPLSFYSNERKGVLMSSITVDVQEVEWSILNVIEAVFKSPLIMIGSIMYMIYTSVQLTIFVFFLVIFAGFVIGKVVSSLRDKSVNVQDAMGNLTAQVEETLGGIRIVKGFNAENYQAKKFDQENSIFRNILTQVINKRDSAAPVSEFLGVSVVVVLLWYGSKLVFQHELAPDTFFAFVFAFYQIIEPAKSFSSAYFNIQKGLAAMERIDRILGTNNEIFSKTNAIKKSTFDNAIQFKDVSFQYKNSDSHALKDINMTINKGQIVALVGSSGAGKSTFVDLLPRFYDVVGGQIAIDNMDIRDIELTDLRHLYGIVSQDAILFHDTIANNISFGETQYSDEQIKQAAIIANAHDFISALPNQYQTNIGDRGLKLSGGQRQRLTIARAILRNPPILILDEATSALDSESERLVQDALHKVMQGRTSIIVAHRLSTIQNADVIMVLENGKIVQSGNHISLLENDGPYKKFVEMQTLA